MKPEWGSKHECVSCGAHFYDMRNPQASCPKCHTPANDRAALLAKMDFSYEPPPAKTKLKDALDDLDTFDDDFKTETDIEDFIEDAADLAGSDENDLSEIIEHMDERSAEQNL